MSVNWFQLPENIKYIITCCRNARDKRLIPCCYWYSEEVEKRQPEDLYKEYTKCFEEKFLFSWEDIPGSDAQKFIDFLTTNYKVSGVRPEDIKKTQGDAAVVVLNKPIWFSLEKTKPILTIDQKRYNNFTVKKENGKQKIHEKRHKYWCWYGREYPKKEYYEEYGNDFENKKRNVRPGVKILGDRIHYECHNSLELIQKRLVGALREIGKCSSPEEEREEKFRRHYNEFGCLKSSFLSEISLRKQETSTQWNFVTLHIPLTLWIIGLDITNKINTQTLILSIVIILASALYFFISYLWKFVSLNEAKDALYICLDMDLDARTRKK